jgi:hypothetical protein
MVGREERFQRQLRQRDIDRVPKIIVVEIKLRISSPKRILNGIATLSAGQRSGPRRNRIGLELAMEFYQFRISRGLAPAVQPPQQMLLFSGAVTPNLLGEAAVAMQAIAVGVIAELQYVGLRRSGHALTA